VKFYVNALVGVIIKVILRMHGATRKGMNEYGLCNYINPIECILYTGDRLKNRKEYP